MTVRQQLIFYDEAIRHENRRRADAAESTAAANSKKLGSFLKRLRQ